MRQQCCHTLPHIVFGVYILHSLLCSMKPMMLAALIWASLTQTAQASASAMASPHRHLDAKATAAIKKCQPYLDACDADSVCAAFADSCEIVGNDSILLIGEATCSQNLNIIQKVRMSADRRLTMLSIIFTTRA